MRLTNQLMMNVINWKVVTISFFPRFLQTHPLQSQCQQVPPGASLKVGPYAWPVAALQLGHRPFTHGTRAQALTQDTLHRCGISARLHPMTLAASIVRYRLETKCRTLQCWTLMWSVSQVWFRVSVMWNNILLQIRSHLDRIKRHPHSHSFTYLFIYSHLLFI